MEQTTHSGKAVVTLPTETGILITREFAAPRHLVYRAWTEPALIRRWWAGRRGTVTVADVDLRVGGRWRFVMTAHGGFEVAFNGEYVEIAPEERIVFTEAFEGMPDAEPSMNTLTLAVKDGRTVMTLMSEYATREVRDIVIGSGMEGGMQEGMDLLEEIALGLAEDA
jgi:uncharacterized protein YndB with AHSA1/START domain